MLRLKQLSSEFAIVIFVNPTRMMAGREAMQLKLEPWLRALFGEKFISSTFEFHVKLNVKWQAKRSHHNSKGERYCTAAWRIFAVCLETPGCGNFCGLCCGMAFVMAGFARTFWPIRFIEQSRWQIYTYCIHIILFNLYGWMDCAGWLYTMYIYILYIYIYTIQYSIQIIVWQFQWTHWKYFIGYILMLFWFGFNFESRMRDINRNCRYFP